MPTTTRSPAVDRGHHLRRQRLVQLYEAEHAGMVRLAHLLTGSVPTAEDLVHEAFIKVYERIDDVTEPGAYLRRTVVNLATSHHRRRAVADRWQRRIDHLHRLVDS